MKVLICGDRNWGDSDVYGKELSVIHWQLMRETIRDLIETWEVSYIVHGSAKGADQMSEIIAAEQQITAVGYPPNWREYGRRAGVIRNQFMLDDNLDIKMVIGFHDQLSISKGTKHMLQIAHKASIVTKHISSTRSVEQSKLM